MRDLLIERLEQDLVGPFAADEILTDRPTDRYLTGILFPQRMEAGGEQDEELGTEGSDDPTAGSGDQGVALANTMRPATAGLSFAARGHTPDSVPVVLFSISCGTYVARDAGREDRTLDSPAAESSAEPRERSTPKRPRYEWQRSAHSCELKPLRLDFDHATIALDDEGFPGLKLFVQVSPWSGGRLVTAALMNTQMLRTDEGRLEAEQKSFFQVVLEARPAEGTTLPARPSRRIATDADGRSAELLYRDAREFAVGHTCSADWESPDGVSASVVRTTWIPRAKVEATSAAGHEVFQSLGSGTSGNPLSASWLASASRAELISGLAGLPDAYERWIELQDARVESLPEHLQPQAHVHLDVCRATLDRMREAVALLEQDANATTAFRLANRAMVVQRAWSYPGESDLTWRPFQLGFLLLSLASVTNPMHEHRGTMDLLWFPTGGGKTEAYLGLIACTLFYRRLRHAGEPERGAGVGAFMRYTLRLLTTQQFQRAAALILACEHLRRGNELPEGVAAQLGATPFSLGLWVGGDAVPNTVEEAIDALARDGTSRPDQIEHCPACRKHLKWYGAAKQTQIRVECRNTECPLGSARTHLPVWTVDTDVYRETPSLVIGTVDKFAQIVRKPDSGVLFGLGLPYDPPDLIIQDELHLISGPLGTMTAAYETAIDELCSRGERRPKIIGSTATIRRAEEQVRALFDRNTLQFPPPGLDADDSCFAVRDTSAPGRQYVGITSAGRSAKFTLQAVCASLLQSAGAPGLADDVRDPYSTLVAYFNSLRELGGALVLMQDDVDASIRDYAVRRGEPPRAVKVIEELTSRVTQLEIRDKLGQLGSPAGAADSVDVLLASNMISVGVDIPRLGLMVVNGQPKGIAEYIQATSRVGRGKVAGLVVAIYNSGKARDRSHFESFRTWHSTLYREVESTSVTPFASRARDRALHAVLVALVRHLVPAMRTQPVLDDAHLPKVRQFAERIIERAGRVDKTEAKAVELELEELIELWQSRAGVQSYWNDFKVNTSLLISAEKAAALRAAGRTPGAAWPTPNSMRNVEPGTSFRLAEVLRPAAGGNDGGE